MTTHDALEWAVLAFSLLALVAAVARYTSVVDAMVGLR